MVLIESRTRKMYNSSRTKGSGICFRLYRINSVRRLRRQIFRQIVQKFRRLTDVSQEISVRYDGIICKQDVCAYLCGIAFTKIIRI